jgi:hypothetical protein
MTKAAIAKKPIELLLAFGAPLVFAILLSGHWNRVAAQSSAGPDPSVANQPYIVEWVYRVKWGHQNEFFDIFRKYQIPVLNREKELGYVRDYAVYSPSLHTSEDARWDYRVIITYNDPASAGHAEEISNKLFPDRAALNREEQRRWEITEVHWDLPIHVVDVGKE